MITICKDETATTTDAVIQFAGRAKITWVKHYTDNGIYKTDVADLDLDQVLQSADAVTRIPVITPSHVTWILRAYQPDQTIEVLLKSNRKRRSGYR